MHRLTSILSHFTPTPSQLTSHPTSSIDRSSAALKKHIVVADEVAQALKNGRPVIALESTIISHGMPYPQNLHTALEVESVARSYGVIPATIAILSGVVYVGLNQEKLEKLAKLGESCHKCSRRDLATIIANGTDGATTVAATMYIAHLVGIKIFVTGGIGGVHRGVESTMDISADLNELGRTPITVVCAGVKSILDIGRTLEYLETQGTCVISYKTPQFPAFFTPDSGFRSPHMCQDTKSCAKIIASSHDMQLQSGIVIAVPIPKEHAAVSESTEKATKQALDEAKQKNVVGRDITPFLLQRINELTGGESLKANIALIKNNVAIGSQIAIELSQLTSSSTSTSTNIKLSVPIIIGGTNQDILGRPEPGSKFLLGTSNPGTLVRHWGGVGRNVAETLARLKTNPILITAVGQDDAATTLYQHCTNVGIQTVGIMRSSQHATSTYMAILDEKGDLFTTIADMRVCEMITPETINFSLLSASPLVIMDGNISKNTIDTVAQYCASKNIPVWFEPTSIEKCVRILDVWKRGYVTFLSPSAAELLAMAEGLGYQDPKLKQIGRDMYEKNDSESSVRTQAHHILQSITPSPHYPTHIILKRGSLGCMLITRIHDNITYNIFPTQPLTSIVNTSGAGDTLVGATCWALLDQHQLKHTRVGSDIEMMKHAIPLGMRAAEMTLCAEQSVSSLITPLALKQAQQQMKS